MKQFIKKILSFLAKNDIMWFFLKPFSKIGVFLYYIRISIQPEKFSKNIEKIFLNNLNVQNGPFKGMKYNGLDSVCSTIYPKLLGCYEKELWQTIEFFKKNKYTEIIDIGCAEGYYAVGLGIIISDAKVYAYDTDENARNLCAKMAKLNNISNKIIINSKCTADTLKSFKFTGRGLIVCDCEGFEKELFNINNINNLTNCDLIIEAHDFFDITISTYLKNVFSETHNIQSIKSIDDIEKALTYNFSGLEELTLSEKKQIFAELRGSIMEWLVCTPKKD